ncbi:polysaccharide deacetylase family protein [Streptomyces uncialis]|uniref:polysaccharide deacetylase family protein n=1 Tax=Streptomyces uncialis TaxID=1048205 RepID=UPI00365132B6
MTDGGHAGRSGRCGRTARRWVAALLAVAAVGPALGGCAQSVDPIERLSRKAAEKVRPAAGPTAGAGTEAYRRWGLSAPPAPAPSPRALALPDGDGGGPPVLDRVPTRDPVVFLVFGDGAGKDPRFAALVGELRLPVTVFLTDRVLGPGYGRLRSAGADVENHTLDHPHLPGLPAAGQRAEICGQRDKLKERFGVRSSMLRPPYGAFDAVTLRVASECGVSVVVRGRGVGGGPLRAGDIVVVEPDAGGVASPTDATIALLRDLHARRLAPARLADYV